MEKKKMDISKEDNRLFHDLILASRFKMSELPGILLIWKYLPVYAGQQGIIVSGDHIIRKLDQPIKSLAKYGVGWNLPLFGRNRQAARIPALPFDLEVEIPRLESGDADPLFVCAAFTAKVQIADTIAFYNNLPQETWSEYHISELAGETASVISKIIQKQLLGYEAAKLLQDEGQIGQDIASIIEKQGDLEKYLSQRGITLLEIKPFTFYPYREPFEAVLDIEELKNEARAETLETILASLQKLEGIRLEDIENIQLCFRKSTEEGQKALASLLASLKQKQEDDLAARALQLSALERTQKPPLKTHVVTLSRLSIYLAILLILGTVSAYIFLFRASKFQAHAGAGAAVVIAIGMLLLIQAVVDNAMAKILERVGNPLAKFIDVLMGGKGKKHKAAPAPAPVLPAEEPTPKQKTELLESFLRHEASLADQAVRNQVSLELSQAFSDLKEARLKIYRTGEKSKAETFGNLANAAEIFRQKVSGAPQHQEAIAKEWKGKESQLASRLIEFEEALLRQAQVFSLNCGNLLEELENAASSTTQASPKPPAVEKLVTALRQMEKHFALRDSIFSGLIINPNTESTLPSDRTYEI